MRRARVVPPVAALLACIAVARAADEPPGHAAPRPTEQTWEIYASLYAYLGSPEPDYLQPTLAADRGALHLEARYNYEDLSTGSFWAGYNLSAGDSVALELTPMLGLVTGRTSGIAAGLAGAVSWRLVECFVEGEYVFDSDDSADSFFYAWSELTLRPVERLRAGLVGQRTRVYDSPRDVQRGILVGIAAGRAELTAHFFNPDDDDPLYVISLGIDFSGVAGGTRATRE
ncbi:MAG TPA: hypothetical protein VD788_11675 [Candidatus Polarisedimenticolaceae bacterium]|nr:hypothetical protein [Candidatus Polarisedimenticolaceae bacterium]